MRLQSINMGGLKLVYCVAVAMISISQVVGQTTDGLVAYNSFDNCDATDDIGLAPDGQLNGGVECGCGAVGNALIFDGSVV